MEVVGDFPLSINFLGRDNRFTGCEKQINFHESWERVKGDFPVMSLSKYVNNKIGKGYGQVSIKVEVFINQFSHLPLSIEANLTIDH
jgi:hypothetical protein